MRRLRLRDLEKALAAIPGHPRPDPRLEQVVTPPDLAARLLAEALALGDVEDRHVVDLGCGTGRLAVGAALLGASIVEGIDVDDDALSVAREASRLAGVDVAWVHADVTAWKGAADTVIMNPPFGAQVRGADRPFLSRAFATAPVVYSMHLAATRAFVETFANEHGHDVTQAWGMAFSVPQIFRHHTRANKVIDVVALRMERR